jgi:hypothetical protein
VELSTSQNTASFQGLLRELLYILICECYSYLTGNTPTGLHDLLLGKLHFIIRRLCSYLTGNTLIGLCNVMGTAEFLILLIFVRQRKRIYKKARPVTGLDSLDDVRS